MKSRDREKSGIVNPKRLSRIHTSPRLFKKRKLEKKGKDYFISILLDASGSMDIGGRMKVTLESMKELSESFDGIVGLHYEVVIFGTFEIKVKDYNETYDHSKVKAVYEDVFDSRGRGLVIENEDGSEIRRLIPDSLLDSIWEEIRKERPKYSLKLLRDFTGEAENFINNYSNNCLHNF